MDKKRRQELKEVFDAPKPERKREFFHQIQSQSELKIKNNQTKWNESRGVSEVVLQTQNAEMMSNAAFLWSQLRYISKWSWSVSAFIVTLVWFGVDWLEQDMLGIAAAFMPLLAVSLVTESGRSERWGMAEFELSARFSLKSVVLARMGILGTANLVFGGVMLALVIPRGNFSLFRTGIYLGCPYLLTTFLGMGTVRRVRGREASYICFGIAVVVSFGNELLRELLPIFYGEELLIWWIIALLLFGAGTYTESRRMIRQAEKLAWNG